MEIFKLPFTHTAINCIIKAALGKSAKSRRGVQINCCKGKKHINATWQDGSKNTYCYVHLPSMTAVSLSEAGKFEKQISGNPFNQLVGDLELAKGYAVIEDIIFCGKNLGFRLTMLADDISSMLPEAKHLCPKVETASEKDARLTVELGA